MISAASREQAVALDRAVTDLLVQSEAMSVSLLAHSGSVLAHASPGSELPVDTLAALASGAFAATREMANILREPSFQSISHEGERISMHVRSAAAGFLVLTVFDRRTTMGLVKLYTEKMVEEIEPILECIKTQNAAAAGCKSIEADQTGAIFSPRTLKTAQSRLANSRF